MEESGMTEHLGSCKLHRACPSSCSHWDVTEGCDCEMCEDARDFGAWLDGEKPVTRPLSLRAPVTRTKDEWNFLLDTLSA